MDRNTMKNTMKSLKLWVLGCVMLFAGVQSASAALKGCEGTVYLKLPDGWTTAFTAAGGNFNPFTKSTTYPSWYEISTAQIGGTNSPDVFHISVARNDYGQAGGITRTQIGKNVQFQDANGFSCKDFGSKNELWIQPSCDDPTKTFFKGDAPQVKYFYVFLPDNGIWKSAMPVINEDGKERQMDIDNDHCGWYYRRYVDEELPTKVFIRRDDDETLKDAIGFGGEKDAKEGKAPEAINLKVLFDDVYNSQLGTDEKILYFVADEAKASALQGVEFGWYVADPGITGDCSYSIAAVIYDTDAQLHPAFSCYVDGAGPSNDGCQKVDQTNAAKGADHDAALKAIYDCVGVTPGIVEKTLDRATQKPKLSAAGKKCFLDEKYFNMLFNYTEGVNEMSCFDLPFSRADDGKWEFNSDTYTSARLKNPTVGGFYPVEDTQPADLEAALPGQTPAPLARTKRKAEGPIHYGPVFREIDATEKAPLIDIMCNGPGWNKGIKCDTYFEGSDEATIVKAMNLPTGTCMYGWTCSGMAPADWTFFKKGTDTVSTSQDADFRWTSDPDTDTKGNGGRNQHFCFESKGQFRFKKGLKFSFRGDDDIWVYIDYKLAVDLGGTHLAAPGYVDLDSFMPDAKLDSMYDIHIFFCDRRTTMSNVRIKTNMFIDQNTDLQSEAIGRDIKEGYVQYELVYRESGGKGCASLMNKESTILHGPEITDKNHKVSYIFAHDKAGTDVICSEETFAAQKGCVEQNGKYLIDISEEITRPRVYLDKLLNGALLPGNYYLIYKIDDKKEVLWSTQIKGSVGVATRNAVIIDGSSTSSEIKFKSSAMGSANVPAIEQMIPIYIASINDPCNSDEACKATTPLQLLPSPNDAYSLEVTDSTGADVSKIVNFYQLKNGQLSMVSPKDRTIGPGGVDTLYVTIPLSLFRSANRENIVINVAKSSFKAKVSFFIPTLVFVESDSTFVTKSSDSDDQKPHLMNSEVVKFYLVALDGNTPCGSRCNFNVTANGSKTSAGLIVDYGESTDSTIKVVDGRATISIISTKKFESTKPYAQCGTPSCNGTATVHVKGPNLYMEALYVNLQFEEPPVPTPIMADIFDVHGELPTSKMNIPAEYFSMQTEYLDGIGDSLAVYYYRKFHKDSLPEKIAVFWDEDEKDSVVFEKAEVAAGATCGAAAGLADSLCSPIIGLSGKKLSKKVKTAGTGKFKSWATYKYKGKTVTEPFTCNYVLDRIAPVIISARASSDESSAKLKIEFSEPVQKTTDGISKGDAVLSFYINNGKNPQFTEYIPLKTGASIPAEASTGIMNLFYNPDGLFPQSGDYLHIGSIAGVGLITDKSDYATAVAGSDTLRPADDANHKWNVAPGYNATERRPSPWVLISGEVSSYAVRIIPSAVGGIPRTPSESADLDPFDIFTYDATKDETDFRNDIRGGQGEFTKYGFVPHGWFVKSDMGALIESKEEYVDVDKKNVFFNYEFSLYTNLGTHVATKKGRIYCDDDKNKEVNKRYFYGGAGQNCVGKRMNFYVLWNMKSDKKRLVGSGAYISKLKTYVQLDNFGKKSKFDKSEMWGVRHNAKVLGSFFPIIKANNP